MLSALWALRTWICACFSAVITQSSPSAHSVITQWPTAYMHAFRTVGSQNMDMCMLFRSHHSVIAQCSLSHHSVAHCIYACFPHCGLSEHGYVHAFPQSSLSHRPVLTQSSLSGPLHICMLSALWALRTWICACFSAVITQSSPSAHSVITQWPTAYMHAFRTVGSQNMDMCMLFRSH